MADRYENPCHVTVPHHSGRAWAQHVRAQIALPERVALAGGQVGVVGRRELSTVEDRCAAAARHATRVRDRSVPRAAPRHVLPDVLRGPCCGVAVGAAVCRPVECWLERGRTLGGAVVPVREACAVAVAGLAARCAACDPQPSGSLHPIKRPHQHLRSSHLRSSLVRPL